MSDKKPSILLVDDADANLMALEVLLDNMGCDLVRATSGNEALRQLLHRDFAVMLLDVRMPDMDGYQVARYTRENPRTRNVPIIFITALNPGDEHMLRGYDMGAVDFLFKPINPQVLRAKVQIFLELYASRRQLDDVLTTLKQRNEELKAFSYSVSHDLRAPLININGFGQALLDDCGAQLNDQGQDYLREIRAAAQRMGTLIDHLLHLSHLTHAAIHRDRIDLSSLGETVIDALRREHSGREVTVRIQPCLAVNADEPLMRVMLENLLSNAWKFTAQTAMPHIDLGAEQRDEGTVFFVRDNGIGFDMNDADKLFRPFQRLHSTAAFPGTGIGLATVQRIVERHGGRVWVQSAVGQGTTIWFTIPNADILSLADFA